MAYQTELVAGGGILLALLLLFLVGLFYESRKRKAKFQKLHDDLDAVIVKALAAIKK